MTEIVGEGKDRHAIVLRVGVESTEVEKIWMEENERLRAEIIRHGWALDCSRCAELIGGSIAQKDTT